MQKKKRRFLDYFLNALLVVIIVILIVPSWRVSFQGWFQSVFMGSVAFEKSMSEAIPPNASNWALFDMNDQMHNFNDFRGKPIVLSFWATWCPPCRAELPELKELKEEFSNQIHVVAASEESIETIQQSGLNNTYSFLYSTPGYPAFFKIDTYPTLMLIDKKMNIVFKNIGAGKVNTEENRIFIKSLISEN